VLERGASDHLPIVARAFGHGVKFGLGHGACSSWVDPFCAERAVGASRLLGKSYHFM
jgi:hypothetical protein